MPVAALVCDQHGRISAYNGRAADLLGERLEPVTFADSLLGSARAARNPEADAATAAPISRVLTEGISYEREALLITRVDGSTATVSANITPLHDERGTVDGAIAVLSELAPREEPGETTYRNLVTNLPVAVYMTDRDGYITLFNEAAVELWGRRPEMRTERWCGSWKLYRPGGDELPLEACPMAVCLREGRAVRGQEVVVERPDGTRRRVLPHPTPVTGADGRLIGAMNVLADVTEHYEVRYREAEVTELNAELLEAVAELRRANAAKDEFLGLVSHELKNPLTTVLGIARYLERHYEDVDQKMLAGCVEALASDAARLAEIIDNMLTLSDAGNGQVELEPVLPARVVEQTVTRYAKQHPQREFSLRVEGGDELALGHPAGIEQVLQNLLSNAHRYSGAGEPVEVLVAGDSTAIEILVRDRGPGIRQEDEEGLFDVFVRGASGKDSVYGLGLGLPACKHLVALMHGEIRVKPRADRPGTEVRVRLPRYEE